MQISESQSHRPSGACTRQRVKPSQRSRLIRRKRLPETPGQKTEHRTGATAGTPVQETHCSVHRLVVLAILYTRFVSCRTPTSSAFPSEVDLDSSGLVPLPAYVCMLKKRKTEA